MYAMFLVLFFLNGQPLVDGSVFPDQEACEAAVAKLPAVIADYNANAENPIKATHYAAGCAPMKKAPQGKEI
jgi:hypothetical protein